MASGSFGVRGRKQAMAVKLGIRPITWVWDELTPLSSDRSVGTILAETRMAGYQGTELGGDFLHATDELVSLLSLYDLELISGWYSGRILVHEPEEEFQAIRPHLTLLRELGCRHAVYADISLMEAAGIAAPISRRPTIACENWPDYGRKVTELADRMEAFGVGMAFHHHIGTIVQTDQEIGHLLGNTGPSVRLVLDTGHCALAGGNPLALLRRHRDRIVHVYCRDVRQPMLERARSEDMSLQDAIRQGVFTVPGDGCIDYRPLLRLLRDHNFTGWLVVAVQQGPDTADPLTCATLAYRNLCELAHGAGFRIESRPALPECRYAE